MSRGIVLIGSLTMFTVYIRMRSGALSTGLQRFNSSICVQKRVITSIKRCKQQIIRNKNFIKVFSNFNMENIISTFASFHLIYFI